MTRPDPDEAIDRDLLVGELEAARFADTDLREDAWNPLDWVYLIGDGLFTLSCPRIRPAGGSAGLDRRPSRTPTGRPRCGTSRLSSVMPGVPVGRFQTETALKQLPGHR